MFTEITFLITWFIIGLAIIVFAGEGFVNSAIKIAEIFKLPTLYIGTFLIGFSTSVPEVIVTYIAAKSGSIDLSIGNVLGSYICNIGYVIGITAIVKPLKISTETLSRAIPLLAMSIIITALLLMIDSKFNQLDGLILLSLFFGYLYLTYRHIKKNKKRFTRKETHPSSQSQNYIKPCAQFIFFLSLLLIGSELMVNTAQGIAKAFKVSELIIGLTIVAMGTSLPELTACIIAVLKNEDDIAVGNVIGSNIFCLLCVLSIPLLIADPNSISPEKLWIPLTVMLIITTVLWLFSAKFDKTCQISRVEGIALVFISTLYLIYTMMN